MTEFATKLVEPRVIVRAPNGDLFLAESGANRVRVLRDADGDGKPETNEVFSNGLNRPFGIAFYPGGSEPNYLYVGNTDSVVRFAYRNGATKALEPAETIVKDIPSGNESVGGGGHWTRDLEFSPDGKTLFVSVGSRSNVSDDDAEKRRADILAFDPDGKNERVFACGHPQSRSDWRPIPRPGQLWTSVNERDGLGDHLVPDYVTHVEEGGFYGWPWYYLGAHQDPRHPGKHPELRDKVIVPDVLVQSHSASLDLTFYDGAKFPEAYRLHAFAAEHGSWNRARRTGYKVIRIPMKDGKATGEYEDFLVGFVTDDGNVWGRPVGVAVARDGALMVTDDGSGTILARGVQAEELNWVSERAAFQFRPRDRAVERFSEPDMREFVSELYLRESRRVFSTLVRLIGDFDLAEEAMHEAFTAAIEQWQNGGVPANPVAWLITAGRFKAIDEIRRRVRSGDLREAIARRVDELASVNAERASHDIEDDRLRLIFTCCHPALAPAAQLAMTLREVCGLTTEQIASAFLTTAPTIAQRIVRAKAKIRDAAIPFEVPSLGDSPDRLASVLSVIYLVFNEGYSASSGDCLTAAESIGRGDPARAIAFGVASGSRGHGAARAHAASRVATGGTRHRRRAISCCSRTRTVRSGTSGQIGEGKELIERALVSRRFGVYTIQAAISAVHADAATAAETDWPQIVSLYDLLLRSAPSPVVELNRAVALAMRDGPEPGLALIDAILNRGDLADYHLAHAARADLCRRLHRTHDARLAYKQALALAKQEPERRFLRQRLLELAH